MTRAIVHLDADAFFASVEQAADTRLRGKPIAVGGEKRGIIASASYEARRFGIYTPMPTALARRLCPKLILLPGDFEKYELFSRLMFSYAYDFTPEVEIGSIDEGYFDLTGARQPAVGVAQTIRHAIRQALKLPVSEGIAANKLVSQIASKLKKPSAFEFVPPGNEAAFLSPLANKWLPGVGPKTAGQLNAAGLAYVGQLAQTPLDLLNLLVGNMAPQLRRFALGLDERPVVPARASAKSYSEQETFAADTTDEDFLDATLRRMADKLMAKVRDDGKSIRTLTVKVRYNDMDEEQAGESLAEPTDLETEIYSRISALLRKAWQRRVSLRLVSLKLSNVYDGCFRAELALDVPACQRAAQQRLAGVVDGLRQKYGRAVLFRGHDFVLRAKDNRGEEASSTQPRRGAMFIIARTSNKSSSPSGAQSTGNRPSLPLNPARQPASTLRPAEASNRSFEGRQSINIAPLRGWTTPASTTTQKAGAKVPPRDKGFPSSYNLSVVQRQRIGNSFARSQPEAKSRANPAPELRFRTEPAPPSSPKPPRPSNFGLRPSPLGLPSAFEFRPSDLSFVPLNIHSHYSFLDSTLSIQAIVDLAKHYELPAIALTDKHNLHGAVEFAQAAAEAGIKPIIGAELDWHGHRLCLYVQNQAGYQNLCRILSQMAESPKSKVQSPKSSGVESHSFDQFAICDSVQGSRFEVQSSKFDAPASAASDLGLWPSFGPRISDFGFPTDGLIALSPSPALAPLFPNRFYLEIDSLEALEKFHGVNGTNRTNGTNESANPLIHHSTTPPLHHSALRTPHSALPLVASFPIHYALPADRWKYDIVQSIRTLTLLRQAHPQKRLAGQYHFRSPAEMRSLFAASRLAGELLAHSREIADRCSFAFSLGKPQFPAYAPPDGLAPAAFLRQLVIDGLRRRYPKDHAHLKPQLEQELAIITDVGYEEYFLVMWDILQECRRRGIEWITRGSAADSLACYCLKISGVCPIRSNFFPTSPGTPTAPSTAWANTSANKLSPAALSLSSVSSIKPPANR